MIRNRGIGTAIVAGLVKTGKFGTVVLTSRNLDDGKTAAAEISAKESGSVTIDVQEVPPRLMAQLDVESEESVSKFTEYMQNKYQNIDVLVNNAGYAIKGPGFSNEIASKTLGVNYFGLKVLAGLGRH